MLYTNQCIWTVCYFMIFTVLVYENTHGNPILFGAQNLERTKHLFWGHSPIYGSRIPTSIISLLWELFLLSAKIHTRLSVICDTFTHVLMLFDICLTSFISFGPRVLHMLGKRSMVELYASHSFLLGQSFTIPRWLGVVVPPTLLLLTFYSTEKIEGYGKEAPWAPRSIVSTYLPLSAHGLLSFLLLWIHFTVFHH